MDTLKHSRSFADYAPGALLRVVLFVLLAACSSHRPTWPLLTDRLPDLDASKLVADEHNADFFFYRTDIAIFFQRGVSDQQKAALFDRYGIRVTGRTNFDEFFVRIPDPGPRLADLRGIISKLSAEPLIKTVSPLPHSDLKGVS